MSTETGKKAPVIHRSKLPHVRKGAIDPEAGLLGDLKRAEKELLDTAGPVGDAAKLMILGEKPANPAKLILPHEHEPAPKPVGARPTRLVLPGQTHYQRGDIIEYQTGRCRFHVVVSVGAIHGVKKIPCYSYDLAKKLSDKMLLSTVQPLSEAEKQGLTRRMIEECRGSSR
jgi:hypothetical protein